MKRPTRSRNISTRKPAEAASRSSRPEKVASKPTARPAAAPPTATATGFTVSPETARMIALGHPWVIADSWTRRWPAGRIGDVVVLTDAAGVALATALRQPGDRIEARILGPGRISFSAAWLTAKLKAARRLRQQHGLLEATDAYRLVNAEGDGLPGLAVDVYGAYLMVQFYAPIWEPHRQLLLAALQEVMAPAGIYGKGRPRDTRRLEADSAQEYQGELLAGNHAPRRLMVEENGLRYLVRLDEGLHTGLFPDQRVNRQDLMRRVKGKRVLNLFCYTGAFSVAAAAAGARQVTSVDVSAPSMRWAEDNFGLNRLDVRRHVFLTEDVFAALERLRAQGEPFDLVLMDPPAFSTTRKNRFSTRGGTARLVTMALGVLAEGGLLISSCNHQKVSEADYLKELRRGALDAGCNLQVIRQAGQPEDFPFPVGFAEGCYLKYVTAVKCPL